MQGDRRQVTTVADELVALYGRTFGGKPGGKYRISRKFLRQLTRRRRLSDDFVRAVGEELFERGYVLIDLETHYAVIEQKLFNSYRRVTATAVNGVAFHEGAGNESKIGSERAFEGSEEAAIRGRFAQTAAEAE